MVTRGRISLLLLLVFILFASYAGAATVQAVADRDRIAMGESLQLQLRVDGSPDGDPDLTALEGNWEILSRTQSSQTQIVNGSFSRSLVYSLNLMPRAAGQLIIPAVCFGQDCSLPLPIEVTKASAQGGGAEESLLLESEISSPKIVTQGQLIFKVRLLRRVDLLDGQLNEPQPSGVSAVVKKLGDDRSFETRRNGRLYQVIERAYAIFPQGVGQMLIPALQFDGNIAAGRTRFDPFGQQGRRVRLMSQPLQVEVTPLPADIGQRPWIPATALDLQDDWQQHPPTLRVGEPATRTLHLGASGVQAAQLPELKLEMPAGFKIYPDQPKREDMQSNTGITGILEQKIALVPTRAGHFTLPAIDLDWWDVNVGRWKSVHLAELEVEVAPEVGGGEQFSPPTGTVSQKAVTPPSPEVVPPVSGAGGDMPENHGNQNVWPWVSLVLALGWLMTLALLLYQRRNTAPKEGSPTGEERKIREIEARKAAVQSARRNDPRATRQALRVWCQILWPRLHDGFYEQLLEAADPVFRKELENLDRRLYGQVEFDWEGKVLADCIAAWKPVSGESDSTGLPGLYPEYQKK